MTQEPRILRNTALLGLSQVIERVGTIYISVLVARLLGPASLGVYSVSLVYYSLLYLAAELGLTTYLVREIAKAPAETSRYVVHAGMLSGALGIGIALISTLVLPLTGFSRDLKHTLAIIVWAIVPACWKAIQEAVFLAYHRAEFLTYSALLATLGYLGVATFLINRGYGVVGLIATFTISQVVLMSFYFVCISRAVVKLHWSFSLRFATRMIRELRPFSGSAFIQGFLSRPELVMLSWTGNDAQIGFYTAALKIVDLWQLIPTSFMSTVFPVMASHYHNRDERSKVLQEKSIKYLCAVSFPITAGMFVAAKPILQFLYGPGFGSSVTVLRVLVWTIPLFSLWTVLWRVLSARGEQGAAFKGQIASLAFRVAVGYALVVFLAALGAALSAVIAMLVLNALLVWEVRRDGSRISFLQLTARSGIAAVGMGVITFFLRDHLRLWELVCFSAIAYAVMILLLKTFSQEDFSIFRNTGPLHGSQR